MRQSNKVRKSGRQFSYSAGEWGETRVRVFARAGSPQLYIDYSDSEGRRRRESMGHSDHDLAKQQADEIALRLRRREAPRPAEITLGKLLFEYQKEVTPRLSTGRQKYHRRGLEVLQRGFGESTKVLSLSVRELNRFVADRRSGKLSPLGKPAPAVVRDRTIQQDIQLLFAAINWGMRASDGRGGVLVERNPLKGLPVPREESPRRPVLTDTQFEAVRAAAATISPAAECLAVLAWETGHRVSSIRQLRWSDVDVAGERIRWRGENDKIANDHTTPLTAAAVEALKRFQESAKAIGEAWIFPSPRNASQCLSTDAVKNLWVRIAERAALPKGQRYGWHSCRRAFASSRRHVPLRDLQDLGGWKTAETVLRCYVQPDEEAQRLALSSRRRVGS